MTTAASPGVEPATVDGDAGAYLEELLVVDGTSMLPAGTFTEADLLGVDHLVLHTSGREATGLAVQVELVGPHLRLAGRFNLGRFRRLSDFLNNQLGLIELFDATVLRRNGDPTKVTATRIWVSPTEVTLIGQLGEPERREAPPEFRVPKFAQPMVFVTPGHTMTGEVYIPDGGDLAVFIESMDPVFVPVTDARTRSLADRRIIMRYPFAMLNRRHIVAATELQPGMAVGRQVL